MQPSIHPPQVYWAGEHPKFPGGGKMTQHLARLKVRYCSRTALHSAPLLLCTWSLLPAWSHTLPLHRQPTHTTNHPHQPRPTTNTQPGDTISVKGPMGKFEYAGEGAYTLNRQRGAARWMSFVAGGSGITPCYAVRGFFSFLAGRELGWLSLRGLPCQENVIASICRWIPNDRPSNPIPPTI